MNIVGICYIWIFPLICYFMYVGYFKLHDKTGLFGWIDKTDSSWSFIGRLLLLILMGGFVWLDFPISKYIRKRAAHLERMKTDISYARKHKIDDFFRNGI